MLGTHLDLQPYLRSAALDNLFANLDSYTLSARNYYLYQNTTLGRWQWVKWDCNETFGSYAMGVPGPMTELDVAFDGGNYERPLLQRILANEAFCAQTTSPKSATSETPISIRLTSTRAWTPSRP